MSNILSEEEFLKIKRKEFSLRFSSLKDKNLAYWANSKKFSTRAKEILYCHIENIITDKFKYKKANKNDTQCVIKKTIHVGIEDYKIYKLIYSIPPYTRANEVKRILNNYINCDLSERDEEVLEKNTEKEVKRATNNLSALIGKAKSYNE